VDLAVASQITVLYAYFLFMCAQCLAMFFLLIKMKKTPNFEEGIYWLRERTKLRHLDYVKYFLL